MPGKTVPLSVRVPLEDAEFISSLEYVGASTPSDKLRNIITDTRKRLEGSQDYEGCLRNIADLTHQSSMRLKSVEHSLGTHSELLQKVGRWAEEVVAYLTSGVPREDAGSAEALTEIESGVADRAFSLIEEVLRMAITSRARCYDPDVIRNRITPVLELAAVIDSVAGQTNNSNTTSEE